jgi:hypothetical protein
MTRAGLPSEREASAAVSNDPNSDGNPHMGNSGGKTPAITSADGPPLSAATNQKKASSIASTNDWKGLWIQLVAATHWLNGGLAPEFEVDHEIQAVFSIADENLAETYRSNRPGAAVKLRSASCAIFRLCTSTIGQFLAEGHSHHREFLV